MTLLRHVFRDRIISKGIWPPRSTDHAPPDYFIWGAVEGAVHKDNPHTVLEVTDCIWNIPPTAFSRVLANKIRLVAVSTRTWVPLSGNVVN
jgi:hypothetical protein